MALSLVSASAADLQDLLSTDRLTSAEFVKLCLQQIEKYDRQGPNLRAMISISPQEVLLKRAELLDNERRAGRVRGPLHGIPIILKDIINTHSDYKMPTTAGSWAMMKTFPADDALLVQKLVDAGLIILGKTNLSEFGTSKGPSGIAGLSAVGGQSQSAYIPGGLVEGEEFFGNTNPGGSSVGSAVGVAAGYSPLSIGGEADGSLQTPASRSALYSLKCTPQSISPEGIFLIMPTCESIGGMAKTAGDLRELIKTILQAAKSPVELPAGTNHTWQDFTLGFVDPSLWRLPAEGFTATEDYCNQIWASYKGVMDTIESKSGKVHYPITLPHPSTIKFHGDPIFPTIYSGEVRESVDKYLQQQPSSEVRSLADIIQFNKEHPELQAGIGQEWLIAGQENQMTPEVVEEARRAAKTAAGNDGIFKVMDECGLDVIASPTDGPISTIAALAGCPTANVPMGYLEPSGRPFGLTFVARPFEEAKLLDLMKVYEATFEKRRLPPKSVVN